MTREQRPSLKLRFANPRTLHVLRLISDRMGVSMNNLAEDMIANEVHVFAAGIQLELEQTLEMLRRYTPPSIDEQADIVARGEVEFDDPLRSRHVRPDDRDPFGVEAAFGYAMER